MKKINKIFVLALFACIFVTSATSVNAYGGGSSAGGSSSGTRINRTVDQQPLTSAQITNLRTEVERLKTLLASLSPTGQVLGESTFNFTTDLSEGMSSEDVKQLQAKLRKEGFFSFATDTGYFGPITKQAVIAYQKSKSLPTTGFVGPLTRAELNK